MANFFIGGAMRSGTTLLQGILCSDEATNPMIAEANYFFHMVRIYEHGREHFDAFGKHYFRDLAEYERFNRENVRRFLEITRERWSPCAHLVLKHPEMTRDFGAIHVLVPDARFIVVIRDPRDTIASMMGVAERQAKQGRRSRFASMGRDMRRLAQLYKSFYGPFLNLTDDRLKAVTLMLKYENLVTNPDRVVKEIASFTGLNLAGFDPGRPWPRAADDLDTRKEGWVEAPWASEQYGEAISRERIGSYRERLSGDEAATIERECADVFETFGYQ